ncbi:hypothetical protein HKX48_002373, partial [Thoreauomyces humboldtii]
MKATLLCLALAATTSVQAGPVSPKGTAVPISRKTQAIPLRERYGGILHNVAKKYGATVPVAITKSNAFKASAVGGSEPLSNVGDFEFYGPIQVGGQTLQMLFDTGSSDIWVPDASTPSLPGKNKYSPKKSSTYKNIGGEFGIQYGSGSAEGKTASETFQVAGVTVTQQVFGDVTSEGASPQASDFDGILGMGFTTIASDKSTTFFENAVAQKAVSSSVFSFYLANTDTGSELLLGGTNPAHYTGPISYVPVDQPGYWQFALKDLTYGGSSIKPSLKEAIADTGTSLVVGPSKDVAALNKLIGATLDSKQGIYTIACTARGVAKDVSFPLNGITITLTSSEYILDDGQGGCLSTFAPLDGLPVWILGDTVLRKYYSIYDLGDISNNYSGARVGFALSSTSGSGPAPPPPVTTA